MRNYPSLRRNLPGIVACPQVYDISFDPYRHQGNEKSNGYEQ